MLYLCSCSWLCFLALSPESFFPRSMGTSPWVTYSFNTHKLITHFKQKTMLDIVEWGEPKKYASKMPSPRSQRWGNHRKSWRTAQCQQSWALQHMPSTSWTNRRLRTNRRKYSYRRGEQEASGRCEKGTEVCVGVGYTTTGWSFEDSKHSSSHKRPCIVWSTYYMKCPKEANL